MIFNLSGGVGSATDGYSIEGSAPVGSYTAPDGTVVAGVMTITGLPHAPRAIFGVPRIGTIQPNSYWGLYVAGGAGVDDLVIYQRSGNYYYAVPNAYYEWNETTHTAYLKVYNTTSTGTYHAVG